MLIKCLQKNVYDVFLGNGFMNWSRVRANHYGLSVIAGNKLPHSTLRAVASNL